MSDRTAREPFLPDQTFGTCVACGGDLELFGPRQGAKYYRCLRCRTLQLYPMPTAAQLAEAYSTLYADARQTEEIADPDLCARTSAPYYEALAAALRDLHVSGLVVDFGAGWGCLSQLLVRGGFQCLSLEPSEKMAAYCKQQGLPVRCGDLKDIEDLRGHVSAFVLCAVFEHLVDHDRVLQGLHRLLKEDGLVVTLHPTSAAYELLAQLFRLGRRKKELPSFHGTFSPPWHTALFSLGGMRRLAQRNGFRIAEIRPAPQGRLKGFTGIVQRCLQAVNHLGWALLGERWPLLTSYVFVLQKVSR